MIARFAPSRQLFDAFNIDEFLPITDKLHNDIARQIGRFLGYTRLSWCAVCRGASRCYKRSGFYFACVLDDFDACGMTNPTRLSGLSATTTTYASGLKNSRNIQVFDGASYHFCLSDRRFDYDGVCHSYAECHKA
jgi:hypothetical protein